MTARLRQTLLAIARWMREDRDGLMQLVRRYDCAERVRHEMEGRNLAVQLDVEIAEADAHEKGRAVTLDRRFLRHVAEPKDAGAC